MAKPNRLKRGDKVAIVSLSSGILGESFVKHELDLGIKRMEEYGLVPVFMENTLKGLNFIANNPEARANDLKQAFADDEIKGIFCSIGGIDTYRTLPYLLSDENFKNSVKNNPKVFLGYSDSTTNHLMLYKLGLNTFYGMSFIVDLAEFEDEMLPYTKNAFEYLFESPNTFEIKSSEFWYEDRTDFSPNAVGTKRISHKDEKGYELLMGFGKIQGNLLGGCLDVLSYLSGLNDTKDENPEVSAEKQQILKDHPIFPTLDEWKNKIMFIETSEEKMQPEIFKEIIQHFKSIGVFNQISGLLVGKPIDEVFYNEYKSILKEELSEFGFPVLYNINIGHAFPHAILPYGTLAEIDAENKTLTLLESALN